MEKVHALRSPDGNVVFVEVNQGMEIDSTVGPCNRGKQYRVETNNAAACVFRKKYISGTKRAN